MWTEDTKKWQEKKVQKVVSLHSMKHGWIICKSHSVLWINFIMLENLSGSHKINSASTLIRSSIVSSFWALFTSFFSHHVFLLFFIFIHNTQQSSQTSLESLSTLTHSLYVFLGDFCVVIQTKFLASVTYFLNIKWK
jgi:hypothetical protein